MERHAGTHPSRALCEMPPVSQAAGQPSAAIIDRQSDNSAEKRGLDRPARVRRGEGGQGKKRHLLVDTQGLVLHAIRACRQSPGPRRRRAAGADAVRIIPIPGKL